MPEPSAAPHPACATVASLQMKITSAFGAFLDPVADKIMYAGWGRQATAADCGDTGSDWTGQRDPFSPPPPPTRSPRVSTALVLLATAPPAPISSFGMAVPVGDPPGGWGSAQAARDWHTGGGTLWCDGAGHPARWHAEPCCWPPCWPLVALTSRASLIWRAPGWAGVPHDFAGDHDERAARVGGLLRRQRAQGRQGGWVVGRAGSRGRAVEVGRAAMRRRCVQRCAGGRCRRARRQRRVASWMLRLPSGERPTQPGLVLHPPTLPPRRSTPWGSGRRRCRWGEGTRGLLATVLRVQGRLRRNTVGPAMPCTA